MERGPVFQRELVLSVRAGATAPPIFQGAAVPGVQGMGMLLSRQLNSAAYAAIAGGMQQHQQQQAGAAPAAASPAAPTGTAAAASAETTTAAIAAATTAGNNAPTSSASHPRLYERSSASRAGALLSVCAATQQYTQLQHTRQIVTRW